MVLLQIVKGTMGIEEIMALRRRKQMTIALGGFFPFFPAPCIYPK
jgi:hypothetical protein